jgi:23S rRNA (cytosine1962-C5)-methyltransferase
MESLRLKPREDRRIRQGHPWIYSNEIDVNYSPLKSFEPGQQAVLETAGGKSIGIVYVNPTSLITARLISRNLQDRLDKSLLVKRIRRALSLRETLYDEPYYRLIYGDSDQLPGLVVDRYDEVLVVQISTVGMEVVKDELIEALVTVLEPVGILVKDNGGHRSLENMPEVVEIAYGEVNPTHPVKEDSTDFVTPLLAGQKTGWFYDHRPNRHMMTKYCQGKQILDVYAYVGAWGIQALKHSADKVTCIERSELAVDCLQENARINGVQDKLEILQGDAFKTLEKLCDSGEKYDVVVVDPPAFIKRKKDRRSGEKGYGKLNQLAMRLVNKDGMLITASCSMHLARENFIELLNTRARHLDKEMLILEQGGQGPDHPVHPSIPETEYLKTIFARIS